MRWSWKIATVAGIPVRVHATFFLLLGWFFWTGATRSLDEAVRSVVFILAAFACVILHEFGHALTARRYGVLTRDITLLPIGGVARLDRFPRKPSQEVAIALMGPAVNVVIAAALYLVMRFSPDTYDFSNPALLERSFTARLFVFNVVVTGFNLIPAFPMDGGRIARAIAWRVTGDRLRATKIAAGLGQAFSVLLICGGLFQIIAFQTLWPLWYVVLGLFLGQAARGAVVQTAFAERLGDVKVEDIMDREPVAAPADLDAERALDEFFHRYRWSWFPVVDAAHHFVGIIRQERVDGAVHSGDGRRTVGELMDADDGDWRVGSEDSLESLLSSEPLRRHGALMAVDPGGVLRGVVTIEQVRRALQSAVAPQAPAS